MWRLQLLADLGVGRRLRAAGAQQDARVGKLREMRANMGRGGR